MAVRPGTDVALRINRLQAERTRWSARCNKGLSPGHKVPRVRGGDLDHENFVGINLVRLLGGRAWVLPARLFIVDLDIGEQLDDDAVDAGIPGNGHRTYPELLVDWRVQWIGVACGRQCGRYVYLARTSTLDLIEYVIQVFSEHRNLLFLAHDAGHAITLARLQEERALARLSNRACHKPIGRVIAVHQNRHA